MWTIELAVMVAMICLNSVFAAYEIALASVGLARLDSLARENHKGATAALRMKKNMEASLAVVQLGITLVGATAAATGGAGAGEAIAPLLVSWGISPGMAEFLAIASVVIPLTVVTIVAGELVPKVFALRNKEWVCLRLSRPMEWFSYTVWPAVWFFETTVELIMRWGERRWKSRGGGTMEETALQELRAIAALARTSRLIGVREERIIVSAARLSTTPVRAIIMPTEYISMLSADATLAESLITAHQDMHTRFPVAASPGDPQTIIGYVNFKDIVACLRLSPREPSVRAIVRGLPSLDADTPIATCLEQLIRENAHIALVRDDETVIGMITLEDILEELVGDIQDEYDRLPAHIAPVGRGWIVGGNVRLAHLREVAHVELPIDGELLPQTLNEWITHRLGRPPHGGDRISVDSHEILVRKVRRHLVQEAQIMSAADQAAQSGV